MQRFIQRLLGKRSVSETEYQAQRAALLQQAPIPVFWLFGKTGSGKTSVTRFLTGAERAEIGRGYQPQTKRSQQFDFPCSETPILRFVDTRGLGEGDYEPAEDIRCFDDAAHVMIVTAKVLDHALDAVIQPLRQIRRASPRRPVVLALTCLHEAYPAEQHPLTDPFVGSWQSSSLSTWPVALQRSLRRQQEQFDGLVDAIVPIDLTRPEEGFDQPNFGGERLKACILELLPAAYRQTLLSLSDSLLALKDLSQRRALPYILSYSSMAASAGAVPVPWVDVPLVMAIQAHMVSKLAGLYGQPVGAKVLASLPGPLGSRLATRLLLRSSWKFVPYVGAAANAALAYASTYGLGRACCWYFGQISQGHVPSERELQQVWSQQMQQAATAWKKPTVR